ncbi:hypothetical protein CBOM_01394 [Ceraceosorus bombacis]|uniref:Uncharacterized protein n=1 Tax=Ceraceosorus bombacis TaxID=401625 RepID=A0A0P1BDU8_9BASI|nr:hypothetical protein CBOM_01394 [Ceraceosorus bombacis]
MHPYHHLKVHPCEPYQEGEDEDDQVPLTVSTQLSGVAAAESETRSSRAEAVKRCGLLLADREEDIDEHAAPSDAAQVGYAEVRPSLDGLPHDILLQIWVELEDPSDIVLVCKRLLAMGKLHDVRAAWLWARSAPYDVIFNAICRPKLLDPWLLRRLLDGGAILSRALVQEVVSRCSAAGFGAEPERLMPSVPKWGQGLSVTTLLALIGEGAKLYGSHMTFQPLDQEIFYEYICLPRHRNVLKPALLALFDRYNFMPLTLSSINPLTEVRLTMHSHLVAKPTPPEGGWMAWVHLISDPDIISAAWRAGFRPQDHPRLSDWICQRVVMRLKPFMAVRNVAAKLKELQEAGLVVLTKSFAASVICDLRLAFADSSWQKANGPKLEVQGDHFTRQAYFALVHLDSMGYLAFDLRSLATELLGRLEQWPGDMTLGPLYRQLEIDFDGINGTHQIACTSFWVAQQDGHPLRWVKTELAGRKDSLHDILGSAARRTPLALGQNRVGWSKSRTFYSTQDTAQ